MSKLRADITYSHHLNTNTRFENTLNINELLINKNKEDNVTNTSMPKENDHEDLMEEELDDNTNQLNLENEFSEYLQDWVDMLKEEELAINDENEFDEDHIIDDITHPAIDDNAKWELITLFKNDLELPF